MLNLIQTASNKVLLYGKKKNKLRKKKTAHVVFWELLFLFKFTFKSGRFFWQSSENRSLNGLLFMLIWKY